MPDGTPAAHASSLLPMPPGHASSLIAFLVRGNPRECRDVQIAASSLDRHTGQWSPARFVVNADAVGRKLGFGVRRLGNPVAWLDARRRIHLFVVATGIGWLGSGQDIALATKQRRGRLRRTGVRTGPCAAPVVDVEYQLAGACFTLCLWRTAA